MSAQDTKLIVAQAHEAIRVAKEERRLAEQQASKRFSEATCDANRTLGELLRQHEESAYELACRERATPYSRSGGQLRHDEASVCEDGLELRWFENDGPDTWFLATWESLELYAKECSNGQ